MNVQSLLSLASRSVLAIAGIIVLMLGLMKLTNFETFLAAVEAHELMPDWSLSYVAWSVPVIEVILGGGMLWAVTTSLRASAFGSLALSLFLLAMTVYAAGLWISPPPEPVSCGCMPNAEVINSWKSVTIRNGSLTAITAIVSRVLIGVSERSCRLTTALA
ncbi:MAG: hypothetical protein KDA29_00840 [Phycisphaerales bacterium]|nr:hypothetical protein [Phycisphaerales bacterium]